MLRNSRSSLNPRTRIKNSFNSCSNHSHSIQTIVFSITLIFKRYDTINHIDRNSRISNIFPIFLKQPIKNLSISIFNKGSFIEYHVLDFTNIRKIDKYISRKSEPKNNDKKKKCSKKPKNNSFFIVSLTVSLISWRIWTSGKTRRI